MVMRAIIAVFLIQYAALSQNRVEIKIPNAATEAAYIWRNLGDLAFFEENNYQLSLPQGPMMENLKTKARENQLTDSDYAALVEFLTDKIYRKENYQTGYRAIQKNLPLLNKMIAEIEQTEHRWPFKRFDHYQVTLTLYGPGGSYDPDRGTIIIFTTSDGKFKQYEDPINTLIHEIVHIGMDESIIRKYQVPHGLKERIVDTFVLLNFKQYLPEYRLQNMGNPKLDTVLKDKADLLRLDAIVHGFMKGN